MKQDRQLLSFDTMGDSHTGRVEHPSEDMESTFTEIPIAINHHGSGHGGNRRCDESERCTTVPCMEHGGRTSES